MNDSDDHLAYLRYERGKAAQTLATYRRLLYQFAEAHRDRDLHALEPRDLQNYLTKTLGGGKYSPATLNQHRAALRSYYRWLHRLRGLPTDPAAALKLPRQARQPLPDALTPEQITTLLEAPATDNPNLIRDHTILELFYSAGLRLAELASLNNRDLGPDSEHPKAREALTRWQAVRSQLLKKADEPALFLNKNGGRLTERGIALRLKAYAAERLPGVNVHPHMLRHTFASHILQSSGDLRSVQELLGHKNLATTQIYTHLDYQHLARTYDEKHPRAKKKRGDETS